ncbi:hypothetical protein AAMO2058_000609600 [Amorphochlora amoebiformis]
MRRQFQGSRRTKYVIPGGKAFPEIQGEVLSKQDSNTVIDLLSWGMGDSKRCSHVSVGINQITRKLEKRKISVVIFSNIKNKNLTRSLWMLCSLRKVPVCVITHDCYQLGSAVGIKRAVAVALTLVEEKDPFSKVVSVLLELGKLVPSPLLTAH